MNKQNKIKPCPFCGGKSSLFDSNNTDLNFYYVLCPSCGSAGGSSLSVADALLKWNTRSKDTDYSIDWIDENTCLDENRRVHKAVPFDGCDKCSLKDKCYGTNCNPENRIDGLNVMFAS